MIETYRLVQLLAIQQCGTLTAASEQLHMTQPALSRSMQKLETELEVSLFTRKANRMCLNENGVLVAEYAKRILELQEHMLLHVREADRCRNSIVFGSCALGPAEEVLLQLREAGIETQITYEFMEEEELLPALEKGTILFAILTWEPDHPAYISRFLCNDQLLLSISPEHKLAGALGVYMKQINEKNIMVSVDGGYWLRYYQGKLPETRFLREPQEAMQDLLDACNMPVFNTTLRLKQTEPDGRIPVPILDEDAQIAYYVVCLESNAKRVNKLLRHLKKRY